jgi:hypothetical protein
MHRLLLVVLLASACKGNSAGEHGFEITSDVKRDSKTTTGLPGDSIGTFDDAKPSLSIDGLRGPIADAMKSTIEKSPIAPKGALSLTALISPASPAASGTLDATLEIKALFAHPPELVKLDATLRVHLRYSNATPAHLGNELGRAVANWLALEHLPENLGAPR